MGGKLPQTVGKRKKLRLKMLPNTKAHAINPVRQYERDCETVLRGLAKFIIKSGFCPQAKILARRRTWLTEGTTAYLEDLLKMGMVEILFGSVWNLTKAGWDMLNCEPVEPTYPPEMVSKADSINEAKYLMKRMKDPEVEAAFDALRAKEQHGNESKAEG
jgi:hypothetical protein